MGIFSSLLDILFPPKCVFCGKIISGGIKVCHKSEASLPETGSNASQKGDFFSVCVSPFYYEDNVRESLLRYKFNEASAYAPVYSEYLAKTVSGELSGRYDLISWVPLSKKRYKERGYDQAMLLAKGVSVILGDTPIKTLVKTKHVKKQSTMGSPEKLRANISGAYSVADRKLIEGKRILLIDDIITSGSTLSECARTLRSAGAAEVMCATLARSRD